MPFATRADLLARTNARRLFNLAVPADLPPVAEACLRQAISDGDLSVFNENIDDKLSAECALDAIDKALADADALIISYGIATNAQNSLLARIASTIAFYYLHSAESIPEDVRKSYEGVVDSLKNHAAGRLDLTPEANNTGESVNNDAIIIESSPPRYGHRDINAFVRGFNAFNPPTSSPLPAGEGLGVRASASPEGRGANTLCNTNSEGGGAND